MKYLKCIVIIAAYLISSVSGNATTIPKQEIIPSLKIFQIGAAIRTLTPKVGVDDALEYGSLIEKYSKIYNIDWKIILAIFKQESNFSLGAVNHRSLDYGIGQFNIRTIKYLNLDKAKLMTDLDYSIHMTVWYLYNLHTKYATIDNRLGRKWYTRYHSATSIYRKIYDTKLKAHIASINKDQKQVSLVFR